MKAWICVLLTMVGIESQAHTCKGFLPANKMNYPASAIRVTGIAKDKFDDVLDRIEKEYSGDVAKRGGVLKVERRWSDGTVNAYADRSGRNWIIHMYGGMARHPAVTYDGFAMVACHELGHHLGGAPVYSGDWASVEGEADYFAPMKCLRRLFLNDDNKKIVEGMTVDPIARQRCHTQHSSQQDEYICIRATMAGLALGKVLVEDTGKPEPRLDTPDLAQVTETYEDHPEGQCRVDGMFQAALCRVPFNQELSDSDYRQGSCTSYTEDGARTRCWFKPD